MSRHTTNPFNSYAGYSPGLTDVRVIHLGHPSLMDYGLKSAKLALVGAMVSSLVLVGAHFRLRPNETTPSQLPVIVNTSVPTDTSQQVVDSEPETVKTVAAVVPSVKQLQAVLNTWRADYPKGTVGIVIKELGGNGRSARLNASQQFTGASLYKLFIADYIYDQAYKGNLAFSQTLSGMPATIGQCLKLSIVVSDNVCGESMGGALGWPTIHNFARNQGFNETTMSPVNETSANDMAKYMQRLYSGKLIKNPAYSKQLLGYMKVQVYRSGVPAGVPGQVVADKVGFRSGLYHDAAIVYGPKRTYILSFMSDGSSLEAVKALSSRVAKFFNQ